MVDQDSDFNGWSYRKKPLGGTETAFVLLAESLSKLGHKVIALTKSSKSIKYQGVYWKPLDTKIKECDIYLINRAPSLLDKSPKCKKTILWLHNPANYLNKFRNFRRLFFKNIKIVCSGKYHYNSIPFWIKNRAVIIPLGLSKDVLLQQIENNNIPDPVVIFTSNPERGLDWLSEIWIKYIKKEVPNAKLHIYAGSKTYGGRNKNKISNIINKIKELNEDSIKFFEPIPKNELFKKLLTSRVMLYKGDPGETFCLSIAEAQALGVPCVIKPIGCLEERVIDKVTGIIAKSDKEFYEGSINILKDDSLWSDYRKNSIKLQRHLNWDNIAEKYLELINS
jgi:glycosyltransferase involved in cell wall biosynthesis